MSRKLNASKHELKTMGISFDRGRNAERYISLRKITSQSTDDADDNDNKNEESKEFSSINFS